MSNKWAMRVWGRAMAMVVALGGIAGGCYGGGSEAAGGEAPVRVIAGEPQADGTRLYSLFMEDGAACVVRAQTEEVARAMQCPWGDWLRADPTGSARKTIDIRDAVFDSVTTMVNPIGGDGRVPPLK